MTQHHNRHMSIAVYISVLAVTDNITVLGGKEKRIFYIFTIVQRTTRCETIQLLFTSVLFQVCLAIWHSFMGWSFHQTKSCTKSCMVRLTVVFTSNLWGVFLILAMTFDRFYGIIRPHKACICIILFGIIYNILRIFITLDVGYGCLPYGKAVEFAYGKLYYWLSFVVNYMFPFVALLVMNSFIIHTIRNRKNLAVGQSEQHQKSSDTQIFIILLLVTFSFLSLTIPSYMSFLLNMTTDFSQFPIKFQSGIKLFDSITEKTWYTNSAINFFLYILSGTKFRKDLMQLFGYCQQR